MKYCSINEIDNFEFHDAITNFISFENNDMVIGVDCLNIHKNTEQNSCEYDMEIEYAEITFEKIVIHTFHDAESIQYGGEAASKKFLKQIINGITILNFGVERENIYYLEGIGNEPFFTAYISFDKICVEWNNYKKKAWYELRQHYEKEICLETKSGDVFANLHIVSNEKVEGKENVSLMLKYNGKDYFACGNDYLWLDSFAKLQNILPNDIKIKSCLMCRHGNMCPFGNKPGEVFCTKDVKIKQKYDLDIYTTNENECQSRSRFYTDLCDDFQMQSEDYYTYNDFLYWLNKMK